jgi:S-adenosylmethionine uptake transporter
MNALWMLVAAFLFSLMGVGVKLAGQHYGVAEIVFYRSLVGVAALLAFARWRGLAISTPRAGLHLRRSLTGTCALALWFYSTTVLPLGTSMTLNYTSPLFLAAFLVGGALRARRTVDWHLLAAILLGFVGILFMLQPSFSHEQGTAALAGLASGVLSAAAYWHVRELGRMGEPEWRTVFYFSLAGTLFGGLGMLIGGPTSHTAQGLLLLASIGISALLAQLAMTRAYARGHALATANLQYSAVVFATLLGILVFGDRIPTGGWIGIAAIVVSGTASTALTARFRPAGSAAEVADTTSIKG